MLAMGLGIELNSIRNEMGVGISVFDQPERIPEAVAQSRIAKILQLPYKAHDMAQIFGGDDNVFDVDADTIFEAFCEKDELAGEQLGGINSSMRNLLLARELNRTVLAGTNHTARIAVVPYTWGSTFGDKSPELPNGYEHRQLYKFVVDFGAKQDPADHVSYADYGELSESVWVRGEELPLTSAHSIESFDPEDSRSLQQALIFMMYNQQGTAHHTAVELLNASAELTDFITAAAKTEPFSSHLSSVEDLSEAQIDTLGQIGRTAMAMWQLFAGPGQELKYQRLVPWQHKGNVVVQMKQPSTRTVTAAMDGSKAAGYYPLNLDQTKSSQAKNESAASELLTFKAQNIAAILSRDPDFEERTEVLRRTRADQADNDPIRLSLGGNHDHPTQTLAELFVILEHFGCNSLEELRAKTADRPPHITFMGHTANKRADQRLAEFVSNHLPDWSMTIVVPDEKYLPTLDLPEEAKCIITVDKRLGEDHQDHVAELIKNSDFVYISNAEGTTGDGGKGDAFNKPDYYLSSLAVEQSGAIVLAPLPASAELDDAILNDDRFNQAIKRTIQYKNAVVFGALIMMKASQASPA